MPVRVLPLLLVVCVAASAPDPLSAQPNRPNILLIVSDDAGYADFGFQGGTDIPTPRLDRLAAGGLRLTQGYVPGPVCSPSRAGMLSGKTPARIGHEHNLAQQPGGINPATTLLPQRLRELGYRTGMVGKWHLGQEPAYLPWTRGFDDFAGFLGGQSPYRPQPAKAAAGVALLRNGTPYAEHEYLTDAFARAAVEFIGRNRTRPWFLYVAFNAVHSPMQARPEMLERFAHIADPQRRVVVAMTSSLDEGVGRILDALDTANLASNTLVIFLNDNGGGVYSAFYNTPLRGHKGSLFEGGIRVPFLARWPARLPAGRTVDAPASGIDLLPTMLAAAGADAAAWGDSDGINLLPSWSGASAAPARRLFWRMGGVAAVRNGDWKLIRIKGAPPLLFNLAEDISEKRNLADAEPKRVQELLSRLSEWERPLPPPRWDTGPVWEAAHIKYHTDPPIYQWTGFSPAPPKK